MEATCGDSPLADDPAWAADFMEAAEVFTEEEEDTDNGD